jgi:hypothetical protein
MPAEIGKRRFSIGIGQCRDERRQIGGPPLLVRRPRRRRGRPRRLTSRWMQMLFYARWRRLLRLADVVRMRGMFIVRRRRSQLRERDARQ